MGPAGNPHGFVGHYGADGASLGPAARAVFAWDKYSTAISHRSVLVENANLHEQDRRLATALIVRVPKPAALGKSGRSVSTPAIGGWPGCSSA